MEHARIVDDLKLWVIYENERLEDGLLKVNIDELVAAKPGTKWVVNYRVGMPCYYDKLQKLSDGTFLKQRVHLTLKGNHNVNSSMRLELVVPTSSSF